MLDQEPVLTPIGVRQVKITDLEPNPHNPRFLFDPVPMNTLEEMRLCRKDKGGLLCDPALMAQQLVYLR